MRKAKLFLIGITSVLLAFGMALTGCDEIVSNAKKAADAASGYTLTLARTTDGQTYTAELYSYGKAAGGGAAQSKNGSAIIKLAPYNGNPSFTGGTYTVRVISGSIVKEKASVAFATGGNTPLNWDTMTVIEEATDESEPAAYSRITLLPAGDYTFPDAIGTNYTAPDAYEILIKNGGNQSTGKLTVSLSGDNADSFVLSKVRIASIEADGMGDFTVAPVPGLDAGTYTATVTVSGTGADLTRSIGVSFTVNPSLFEEPSDGSSEDYPSEEAPSEEVPPKDEPPAGDEAAYGIELSQTETLVFDDAILGYTARTPQTITITNTGSQPTGDLTVALGGANGAFTVAPATIGSIAADETAIFAVVPKTGLEAGPHIASVTVRGENGILKGFYVSFTVGQAPVYAINLNTTGTYTFPSATAGYGTQTARSVTITNSGNQPTGALTLALSNNSAFTLSTTAASSIAAAGSNYFTVVPRTGLAAGSYSATVTVSGGNGIEAGFNVSFTVGQAPVYGINLDPSGTWTFPAAIAGYGTQAAKTVNISNSGNRPTGDLTVSPGADFEVTAPANGTVTSIPVGGTATFSVRPKTGLAAGAHPTTIMVRGAANNISAGFGASFYVSAATYGVNLDVTGTYTFPSAIAGYGTQTAKTVKISNSGNQPTGNLTLALSNSASFTLSSTAINTIGVNGSNNFTVTPKIGLLAGTYSVTITVSGGNGIFAGFNVNFTVNPPAATPVYGIALSENGNYTFPAATAGYGTQTAKSVTISNTGNQPTGYLTISLSNSSAFTLSTTAASSIAAGGSNYFTVVPKTGLAAGTYSATVTVSGASVTSKSFSVSFTVNATPVYGISLNTTGTHTFPSATAGYGAQTAKSVTISNTGNQPTGNLTLSLSSSTAFTLSTTSMSSIGVNGSNSFTVTPKTGLSAGSYSATVTVSGGSVESKSFSVSFTVNAAPTYGISLNPETWTFPAATAGYGAQTAKSVTISNTGNQPTGNLTLALSNSTAFTLSTTSVNSIGANGSNSFTVTPKTGLSAGTYSATVTVSGASVTSKSFSLSFTVNAAPTYGISLDTTGTHTFPSATYGYGTQTAKTVNISNTGNQPTGNLAVSLSSSSSFTLSTTSVSSIAAGGYNYFTVVPKTGLAAGTYSATVTVSGGSVTAKSFNVSFTVGQAPTYSMSLNPSGTYAFPAATVGYGAQTAKSVTITNTGNQPTGALTLALSNSTAFTLSAASVGSIAAGGSSPFTVTPKTGLAAGTHSATVTVSGGNVSSKILNVSFTVSQTPTYSMSLNPSGTYAFPAATVGYGAQPAKSVTITNTGNQPTGVLTLALSNSTAFTLSAASVSSIAAGGYSSFTVTPKTGLAAGAYSAAVTVIGGMVGNRSLDISFTVNPVPTYGINLDPSGTYAFPAATVGYGAQTAKSVTITNTGNQPTGYLTIALSNSSAFTLSSTSINSIAAGGSSPFTVTPKTGLAAGTYSATVTVSGGSVTSKNFSVSFTVEDPALTGFSNIAAAIAYLESYAGGSSFNAPVPLKMNINLDSATDGWTALLNGLASVNKYVALDLSSCTKSSTGFSFSSGNNGTKCIAVLTLPDSITSVSGSSTTYSWYPNLKIVSGANVTSIGDNTFYNYTSLATTNFPEITSIGRYAFRYTSLTTASFPKATSIGTYAFDGCTSLSTAFFPEATSIGDGTFHYCTSLTTVSFPEATSIGSSAFYNCTSLSTASFSKATTVKDRAFGACISLTALSLPKVTAIWTQALIHSGSTPLVITFGDTMPPTIGDTFIFDYVTTVKIVTVRVPNGATGYDGAWIRAFKGEQHYTGSTGPSKSNYVSVVIEYY